MRRFLGVAVIVAVLLGLGALNQWFHGKGEDPQPVISVGAVPSDPAKISLPKPGPDGIAPSDEWPDACSLITDGELRSVLPQATSITRTPHSETFELRNSRMESTGRMVVPRQNCDVNFDVPHKGKFVAQATQLKIAVGMVGSPVVAWLNYGGPTKKAAENECKKDPGIEHRCRKNGFMFSVDGQVGPGTKFAGQQSDGREAAQQVYFDSVLSKYTQLIFAKVP